MTLDTNRTFKLTKIVKIFNVKRHFIINLVETGIIKPLVDAKGRGKSRQYSYNNLLEIGIFIYLNKLDLSYEMARRVLNEISDMLKYHPKEKIETIPYISVLGFLNGKIDITASVELFPDVLSPEHFLSNRIADMLRRKKVTSIADFAYYFVLDVRNISSYINSQIE